jgi:tetratricopeptide (TPR) repeat protein
MGLVVGARWQALGVDQGHITDAAEQFAEALFDPALGACNPALDGTRVVHDPGLDKLEVAFAQAFASAARAGATLAICMVGHGYRMTSRGPYFFVPSDHPRDHDATGRHGYPLAERIPELDARYPGTDGLILLVDACGSGELWRPSREQWQLPLRRLVLATATSTGKAWGARFTGIISEVMEAGVRNGGDHLRLEDFWPALAELTQAQPGQSQEPHSIIRNDGRDTGLWITINRADRASKIASLAMKVARHQGLDNIAIRYQRPEIPDAVRDARAAHRALAVLGPSGCGKSATLQMIAIDELDLPRTGSGRAPGTPWQAVAFFPAAADTDASSFARETYDQLIASSHWGFEDAFKAFAATVEKTEDWNRLPTTEQLLTGPMRHLPDGASVVIVVDALDQLPPEAADGVIGCLSELATAGRVGDVRIVVSARHRAQAALPRLPDGFTPVTMPDPSHLQVLRYLRRRRIPEDRLAEVESIATGNWLIITLLCNGLTDQPERSGDLPRTRHDLYNQLLGHACGQAQPAWESGLAPVMAVLACAGAGVALPLSVLRKASARLAGPDTIAAVRGAIVALHRVVERVQPGTADERVMLIHPTLVEHLASPLNAYPIGPLPAAHSAVADALAKLAPMAGGGPDDDTAAREYASRSEATHRWEAGDYEGSVAVLAGRPSSSARENRDRWETWTRRVMDRFGPAHPLALRARQQLAYWTSRSGLYSDALHLYQELTPLVRSALGEDDLLALRVVLDEAKCRGVSGQPAQARDQLLLLESDAARAAGPFGVLTLEVRLAVGTWTGLAGAPRRAAALLRPVLLDCLEHLGEINPVTLSSRSHLARWSAESGEPARALEDFRALLPAQLELLGPTHRETLRTRYAIAYWTGEAGRRAETLRLLKELIGDQRAVLGDEHPDTLRTLHGIGLWSGMNDDCAEAVRVLAELLPVRERVLGPDHADTLRTLNNLGRWTGALGRYAEAIEVLQDTLERRTRTLGAEHPDTMRTVNNIIDWTGEAGDYRRAYELAGELLPKQQRVIGESHQDTMRTRFNAARWLAKDGSVTLALEQLVALHRDQVAALSAEHPDAQRTAALIGELSAARDNGEV